MIPTSITATPAADVFKRAGVRDTVILLALAWAVPFLVHLLPWSGPRPLGVYLLPMFWTAFVATYFFGNVIGLAVGLFAPAMNLVVTGLPAGKYAAEATLELTVFAFATAWAVGRAPRFFLAAPLGYIVARLAWAEWLALTDTSVQFDDLATAGRTVLRSLVNGAAGLVVLAAINLALVWFYPKGGKTKASDPAV
jgi:hypothetical protein